MFVALVASYLLTALVTLVVIFVGYFKWSYQYYARRNQRYLEPRIPFGNLTESATGKENILFTIKRMYSEMKSRGWKHGGLFIFASPNYMVLDLDLIKNILTRDFPHFTDRGSFCNEEDDYLNAHLANVTGGRWKSLRSKLTPTFTSGKLKIMFHTLVECQEFLHKRMGKIIETQEPIDIKDVIACFTTDVIGSCAFGLDCNAIEKSDSLFRVYGKKAVRQTKFNRLKRSFASSYPQIAKKLRFVFSEKDVVDFFTKVVTDTINYREENNVIRNDFMQMLIELKNKKEEEERLTMKEIIAQSFVFFVGGFETSSTLMSFALYELARNQELQAKLRSDINRVLAKHDNQITYEAMQDMKYAGQVLDEALRLYPPAPLTNRKCQKDYKIPGEDIIIEKGTSVIIPIVGIHHDPEYYPEPEKFDPDRFSDANKAARHNYTHLPFGEGPRNCIGMRFGLMQAKVGLVALVQKYNFTVNKKTIEPLQFHPSSLLLAVKGDIWLNATKV